MWLRHIAPAARKKLITTIKTDHDVIIIGAGPAGLSLARSLAKQGLRIALIERQPEAALANPADDGREIALTRRSIEIMRGLDAWDHIPAADISPLGEAAVRNGASPHALHFQPSGAHAEPLGHLVPNHQIRRALYQTVSGCDDITLYDNASATSLHTTSTTATVTLANGIALTSRLAVAADTRFSEMRRRMGIPAQMRDFGKTMLVCRMAHSEPHHAIATEWFGYGQTIAALPLNGTVENPNLSSLVVTMPARQIEQLMALEPTAFATEITRRYHRQLGGMQLVGTRNAYPLVAVYADRFVAERFALVGDAAVGMHPVTAHGFNFGLIGQDILASLIAANRQDIGAPDLLARYQARLRRATRPLYLATNATVLLYTDDRLPARALRDVIIRIGERARPLRKAIAARLMTHPQPALPLRAGAD